VVSVTILSAVTQPKAKKNGRSASDVIIRFIVGR